tara:strand:- start:705 stop:1739 length:1035 start_codon:yes stop_codon:yes gene_type:complete
MKRILILQNKILHYRKPLYNKLSKNYEVTILHSGKKSVSLKDHYREIITPLKTFSKLFIQKGVWKAINSGNYDVVIAMMDIQWINNLIASFYHPSNIKFIWWGIIASKNKNANKLRGVFLRNKPTIFYTKLGLEKMKSLGFTSPNYGYCNNTFHIENRISCHLEEKKDSFLFVGSLDSRKRIDILINAFSNVLTKIPTTINLKIIGDGHDFDLANRLITKLKLKNRVELLGRITETEKLQEHYKSALFSISFGQAGLGILQSLGYGVPFITSKDAISGGEISNIKHEFNGILCENNQASLEHSLIKYANNYDLCKDLGKNAFEYYTKNCTIEQMIEKFSKIIEA